MVGARLDHQLPERMSPKLIVIVALDHDENGEPLPVLGFAEQQAGVRAVRTARTLAKKRPGVIAQTNKARLQVAAGLYPFSGGS